MTHTIDTKVLVIGYGNPARGDDGLGPAAIDALEKLDIAGITLDADYQLTVENAVQVAEHDVVIFIDAAITGNAPYSFTRLEPKYQDSFSSHSVEPAAVLGLAENLFHAHSEGYLLGIRGYSFPMFIDTLTKKARENLTQAVAFLKTSLQSGFLHQAVEQQEVLSNNKS